MHDARRCGDRVSRSRGHVRSHLKPGINTAPSHHLGVRERERQKEGEAERQREGEAEREGEREGKEGETLACIYTCIQIDLGHVYRDGSLKKIRSTRACPSNRRWHHGIASRKNTTGMRKRGLTKLLLTNDPPRPGPRTRVLPSRPRSQD